MRISGRTQIRLTDLRGRRPAASSCHSGSTGPKRSYDMAREADRRTVYEVVLQEGLSPGDVERYANGTVLVEVWPRLRLPRRARQRWEGRFSQLTSAG